MIGDKIKLYLPARAEYILTIRMAVSAIATRLNCSLDVIEDLKAGAAEACIMFLNLPIVPVSFDITISISSDFSFEVSGVGETSFDSVDGEEAAILSKCLIEEFYEKSDFSYEGETLKKILISRKIED